MIAALLSGDTIEQAARKVPCSPRTVKRRLADRAFRARLEREREWMFRQCTDLLVANMHAAGRKLAEHMNDPDTELSLRACNITLTHTIKLKELAEFDARLSEVEAKVKLQPEGR
jgi:hypothetical protein